MLLHILTSVKILQGIGEGKGILGQCIAARRVISVLLIAVKPEKPFRMFLHQRAVLHDAVGDHIQDNLYTVPVEAFHHVFEILFCAKAWVQPVRPYAGVFRPYIIEVIFSA